VIIEGKVSNRESNGRGSADVKIIVESGKELLLDEISNYSVLPSTPVEEAELESLPITEEDQQPDILAPKTPRLFIRIDSSEDNDGLLSIKNILDDSKGDTEVVLVLGPNKQTIKLPLRIATAQPMMNKLKKIVGQENVKIN
jgi:hypothetical protein